MKKILCTILIILISFPLITKAEEITRNTYWDFTEYSEEILLNRLNVSRTCASIHNTHSNVIDIAKENNLLEMLSEEDIKKSKSNHIKLAKIYSNYTLQIRNNLVIRYNYNKDKLNSRYQEMFEKTSKEWLSNSKKLIENYSLNSKEMQYFLKGFNSIKKSCRQMLINTPVAKWL